MNPDRPNRNADPPSREVSCAEARDLAPAFVLGALDPEEMAVVRSHLATCPEAHAEFAELGAVVPALLESVPLTVPPAALRTRILDAARADEAPTQGRDTAAVRRPVIRERPRLARFAPRQAWAALGLAAAIAVLALGAWNVQLRTQVDGLTAYRDGVLQVLDLASKAGAGVAVLTDPQGTTTASGIAAVGTDGRVAVAMRDLAPTAGSQVYEVWLVLPNRAPLPVGSFPVEGGGSAVFSASASSTGAGVVVALTREPGPGATTPTLPLIAAGVTRPAGG